MWIDVGMGVGGADVSVGKYNYRLILGVGVG